MAGLGIAKRGEKTHPRVYVTNTQPTMINSGHNMIPIYLVHNYQYSEDIQHTQELIYI